MAAVYALVLVPSVAAALFMIGTTGGGSFTATAAVLMFVALVIGMLVGLFRLINQWENDDASA